MRIVFDVSPLSHPRSGVGNYIRGSFAGLVEAAGSDHEVVAFAPTSPAGAKTIRAALEGIPVETRLLRLPFAHAWRTAWSLLGHPAAERWLGPFDALHFTDWMTPPQRSGIRSTTVHDLVPTHFPQWTTARTRSMHGRKDRAAKGCDVVFCNSEHTAGDVERTLGIPRERLLVAYPGLGDGFGPDGSARSLPEGPYLLTVATLEPRKNLGTLLEAHRLLGDGPVLAVAGAAGWGGVEVSGERVVRLGYVADEELPALYRGASALVYPSRFEGFGIPVIEAMACGVPTVVSSHPSLDEACGDAAVRVDPESPQAVAAGIEEALRRRDELVPRGLAHAARFSWSRTGEIFLRGFLEASR